MLNSMAMNFFHSVSLFTKVREAATIPSGSIMQADSSISESQ